MNAPTMLPLDTRDSAALVRELLANRPGYTPEWIPPHDGVGAALPEIAARYVQAILQRLNQAPYKNQLAFLEMLGIQLIPAQAARAPVVFGLAEKAADVHLPAGARVAAPPPPGSTDQIVYETVSATGLSAGKLVQVVSLWPGRDQYIDHSAAAAAHAPFQLFHREELTNIPHILYLAHGALLALAGACTVEVTFDLVTGCSERLDVEWEYWDGNVWRPFLGARPECDDEEALRLDSSQGLTRSGTYLLQTDCAATGTTTVNGYESYWIRGRLTVPLPPDPARILPAVDRIELGVIFRRPLAFAAADVKTRARVDATDLLVKIQDQGGKPFKGVNVHTAPAATFTETDDGYISSDIDFTVPDQSVSFDVQGVPGAADLVLADASSTYEVDFTLSALAADKAFADQATLELDKTFFPFGQVTRPGSTFYFSSKEILSKPGAHVQLLVISSQTTQDAFGTADATHVVRWEYWNGLRWTVLPGVTSDLTASELITFDVPLDLAPVEVNGENGYWVRAALVSGSFAHVLTISTPPLGTTADPFKAEIPQPPALAGFYLGYSWEQKGQAEKVFGYNDFSYEDDTEAARWPGAAFQPYTPPGDVTPAVYLGFDKKPPVDRLGILFDIIEEPGDLSRPALRWQYWDGFSWEDVVVDDETRALALPGLVGLIGAEDSAALARFDVPRFWLRARLKEDGPPPEPRVKGIYPNAAWVVQQQTTVDEPVGVSTGQEDQTFRFRVFPVQSGERVEVREVAGLRANVEWRIIARQVLGDPEQIRQVESLLAREGPQTSIEKGDLRLTRDRNKRVVEVWVRWHSQLHLFFSGPDDRDYTVDRARGLILFGDSRHGLVPPVGAAILARLYRAGGGAAGNAPALAISQVLGPVGGIEQVFNPRPAEGGADGETIASVASRGPRTVRHRGRAVLPEDYEVMAREANANVAVAHALACTDPSGRPRPGWVRLVIIPQSTDPQPWPTFGLRQEVQNYLDDHAGADIAALAHITVTGPEYVPVDIEATVTPVDPTEAGAVETRARQALLDFLHPLRGGPDGEGWPPGRAVFLSDIASVLERVEGVDYTSELNLLVDSELQGTRAPVAPNKIVAAGEVRIKMVEGKA